jgi:hypothetical protein
MPKRTREERIALAMRKKAAFRLKAPYLAARAAARRLSVPRGMTNTGPSSGFPPKRVVTLKYCQQVSVLSQKVGNVTPVLNYPTYALSMTPLQAGHRDFRCNGCVTPNLDPAPSFQGHQPRDWDTYAGFYRNYKVRKSKIIVQWSMSPATSGENYNPTQVGITRLENTTDVNAYVLRQQLMEDPSTRQGVLTGPESKLTLSNNWASKAVTEDDGPHTATTVNDPADQDTYVLWASEIIADNGVYTARLAYVECLVTILYTVEFYNRRASVVN